VSQSVRQLETELGLELFRRSTRQVTLTAPGEVLVARVERVIREIRAAKAEVGDFRAVRRGSLTVGVTPIPTGYFGLPSLLSTFVRRHPDIDLVVQQHPSSQLLQLLRDGALDLGMLLLPPRERPSEDMEVKRLFSARLRAVVRPDHPFARLKSIDLATLAGERLILSAHGAASRVTIERALNHAGLVPRLTPFTMSDGGLAMMLVSEGLGVGFSLEGLVEIAHPELTPLEISGPDVTCSGCLVVAENGPRTGALRAFMDVAHSWIWEPLPLGSPEAPSGRPVSSP